ncbi:uncharacterized protein LOC112195936 isoform X1 [Rosa chinensis]|uniref:uncharacterized protein LOC112195936 isoform X1 n=1 Tax=Rosa chinensis TaxID=74649 RepID=UPI001AD91950|nr:uncharacterized protein LOC112195936 isoform X1 [Rosa chinensis]XP_040373497.1 uncharacterized protein LOC112195936 isoform X1 [Rosa chinensis]
MKSNTSLALPGPSLASVESLSMPVFQEVVLASDIRCTGCQRRLADMISKLGADIESVVVSASEKKVTLVCRYPSTAAAKVPSRLVPASSDQPKIDLSSLATPTSWQESTVAW